MPDPESPDLPVPEGKIFPRNLTARADFVVRGNPPGTRPESGVDNCFPGLEFDQRNLEKHFFPGLTVDFHRGEGSQVIAVTGGVAAARGLTGADLPLYLWEVCGRTTVDQTEAQAPVVLCRDLGGLDVWRRVHDLLPGAVAVVVGPVPGVIAPGQDVVDGGLNRARRDGASSVVRAPDGTLDHAVLVADRARFLNENGVIDPEVYEPGDLTRSLCAPWQYDFRDCGCYYWAASKPDIATSSDGRFHDLNFLRRDRTTVPPEPDLKVFAGRTAKELTHPQLIADWNVLPVVLNGREDDSLGLPATPVTEPLTPAEVIAELEYLATVEHALCVEYLYAHYSLAAPMTLPDGADAVTRRVFAAADEVFSVAVDEMRHLRWVNEALGTLGRPPRLGRATAIHRQLDQPFELKPLTAEQLDWFIDVERPSQQVGTGVDGMYVRLHQALIRDPQLYPGADRLAHLIKLIIDEGEDHFHRFTAVKGHLAGLTPAQYLRPLAATAQAPLDQHLLDLGDQNYAVLLGLLDVTFGLHDRAGGVLIEQARRAMTNLHEINHLLAGRGLAPRFTLPAAVAPAAPGADPALTNGQATRAAAEAAIRALTEIGALTDPAALSTRAVVTRHRADMEALLAALSGIGGQP
ncbi:ferritin-like domain-containing protein [Kitasatospora sp. NPDC057223]|uniref:ferritin-like domain-containing protein n=1 Tax=Kitasatospora sp. NPDC057223 TaxID=3346055 RepID=UPI0036326509